MTQVAPLAGAPRPDSSFRVTPEDGNASVHKTFCYLRPGVFVAPVSLSSLLGLIVRRARRMLS
jgi:hypothetical protein